MSVESLRVCFLSNSMGVGGTDRQILYIAEALRNRGHEIKIISLRPPREMGRTAERQGLNYESLQITGSIPHLGSISQLWSAIREFEPDVLCCFLYHANILGRIIGTAQRVPVITTSLRNEALGGWTRKYVMRWTEGLDNVVTTNSRTVTHSLVRRGVVSENGIQTIHNAIDVDAFRADEGVNREQLEVDEDTFLWITVGRLNEQKDHETLLHAMALTGDSQEALIVGDGEKRKMLTELARDLGISNQIHFLGERHDVPALLATADAFVLSSAWEGLPNVVMEALAAELPVVSTDIGGVAELVEDGKSGLIVSPGDSTALAEAMDELVAFSKQERREMGECGREHMQSAFSIETIAAEWEELFLAHLFE